VTKEQEALKLAYDVLKNIAENATTPYEDDWCGAEAEEVLPSIEEALAQPVQPPLPMQEPVAWMHEWADGERIPLMYASDSRDKDKPVSVRPLVFGDTTPQPRPWVGLTDDDLVACSEAQKATVIYFMNKLKEKNT
jgi:hypothetical protein